MNKKVTVGIDIGTFQVKVVIAEEVSGRNRHYPKILGTGFAESKGLRHGYIINSSDTRRSLEQAITQAEKASGHTVKNAYLSVGGVGLEEVRTRSEVVISRVDSEVTDLDVTKALDECERAIGKKARNRKIIHAIPIKYWVDGEEVLGRPQGMKGSKLVLEALFVTTLEQHLQDLIAVIEDLGISVVDVMASPLAGSFVTLSKAQKMSGCILANIGAETVSIVVYENNIPISVKVFPIGSTDITNDIALGLKISLDDAEKAKRGALVGEGFSEKKLDEIVTARLRDMFDLIEAHLQKIDKSGLLPAGIVISGGASSTTTIEDLARATLKLPSKRAMIQGSESGKVKDASWAVAYGLCVWGLTNEPESAGFSLLRETGAKCLNWFKQFLP